VKDCIKPLREGLYAALNGNISVPVKDGIGNGQACVIVGNITEVPSNTLDNFRTDVIVELDIVTLQKNSYSRDQADTIADEILSILIPSVDTAGFSVAGFQVTCVQRIGGNYIDEPSDSGNIVRKILRIQQTLSQI
jgi:hypothetical protein